MAKGNSTMQWLIDIVTAAVIELIGVPPCFIDRGDPDRLDLTIFPPTMDDAWHDWDLSALVPTAASAVLIRCVGLPFLIGSGFTLRTNGNVNMTNVTFLYSQIAGIAVADSAIVALKADRTIEYMAPAGSYQLVGLAVGGWWL